MNKNKSSTGRQKIVPIHHQSNQYLQESKKFSSSCVPATINGLQKLSNQEVSSIGNKANQCNPIELMSKRSNYLTTGSVTVSSSPCLESS
jgi:hypothetical protein